MKSLMTSISNLKKVVEDFAATTAALAPYPVATVGTVVIKKDKKKKNEKA